MATDRLGDRELEAEMRQMLENASRAKGPSQSNSPVNQVVLQERNARLLNVADQVYGTIRLLRGGIEFQPEFPKYAQYSFRLPASSMVGLSAVDRLLGGRIRIATATETLELEASDAAGFVQQAQQALQITTPAPQQPDASAPAPEATLPSPSKPAKQIQILVGIIAFAAAPFAIWSMVHSGGPSRRTGSWAGTFKQVQRLRTTILGNEKVATIQYVLKMSNSSLDWTVTDMESGNVTVSCSGTFAPPESNNPVIQTNVDCNGSGAFFEPLSKTLIYSAGSDSWSVNSRHLLNDIQVQLVRD